MKKLNKLFLAGILMFMSITTVNAETCKIISGDGTKLGDLISCAGEEFYVLNNDGNKINMLAKYNLLVGDKIEATKEFLFETYKADNPSLNDEEIRNLAYNDAKAFYDELYKTYKDRVKFTTKLKLLPDNTIEEVGFFSRIYSNIDYTDVKQDSKAKGLTINNNYTVYPIYGSTALDNEEDAFYEAYDDNGDLILETSTIYKYITGYEKYLKDNNIDINKIELLKLSRLEKILSEINGKKINIDEIDYDIVDITDSEEEADHEVFKSNIKNLIGEKYAWLYQTTYWIGSGDYGIYTDDFLTTNGDFCSSARGCDQTAIGVGVRPVVSIDASKVSFEENPVTEDNVIKYIFLAILSIGLISIVVYRKKLSK